MSEAGWKPKITVFHCSWCSRIAMEQAGIDSIPEPSVLRTVPTPCTGTVNPLFILKALQNGSDGVLVTGCNPGDCHFGKGNLVARRRFSVLNEYLEYIGVEAPRVQFLWVSAAEGKKLRAVLRRMIVEIREMGPEKKLLKKSLAGAHAQ